MLPGVGIGGAGDCRADGGDHGAVHGQAESIDVIRSIFLPVNYARRSIFIRCCAEQPESAATVASGGKGRRCASAIRLT